MTTIEIIIAIALIIIAIAFVGFMTWNVIIVEIIDWIEDKKIERQLKKEWESKTGVYAYLKK